MATGPEHYAAAERCIAIAEQDDCSPVDADAFLREAQAHATLALVAATASAARGRMADATRAAWREVIGD